MTGGWVAAGITAAALFGVRLAVTQGHEIALRRHRPRGPDGIVRGGEPIRLVGAADAAVLVLHGFGDTPQSVAPVARALHAAGWTVEAPLLAGHGRTLAAMAAHDEHEWLASARAAYDALRRVHGRVSLVGQSMGGALAVQLAATTAPPALVLLAPYLDMPVDLRRTTGRLAWLAPIIPYWRARGKARSIHDPAALAAARAQWSTSVRALQALERASDAATAALPQLTTPTLLLQSREDHRIPPDVAQRAFDRIGSAEKSLRWFTGRGHVLAVDHGHAEIAEAAVQWIAQHGGAPAELRYG